MSMDFERMKKQLLADKKKLGILVMLAFVGLLMWGRLLMTDVPRTATAKPKPAATTPADRSTTTTPMSKASSVTRRMPEVAVDLSGLVTRDLFAFHGRGYPPVADSGETGHGTNRVTPTKLVLDPADKAKEREKAIRAEAADLRVQSTILGAQPRALINGQLLAPGEAIQGFKLSEVRPRSVTLTKESIEIVLEM